MALQPVAEGLSPLIDRASADRYARLHGTAIRQKANRFTTYLKDPEVKVFKTTISPILISTASGAAGGALIGGCLGGPKGAAIGAGTGAGGGFIVGCVISAKQTSKSYKAWLAQYRSDESFSSFLGVYKRDSFREKFVCPITQEPFIDPVISPNGRVYERASIEQWVREHETDPFTREPLRLEDLRTDHTTLGKHCKELKKMLTEKSEEKGLDKFSRKGIEKLQADLDHQAECIFQEEMKVLNDQLIAGKITRKEFSRQMAHLQAVLDGEET